MTIKPRPSVAERGATNGRGFMLHYPLPTTSMRRRGFTLIEMIAVITASTALMGIAVCLLVLLMRAEGGGREHQQRQQSLARLAEQFRRDVHAAVDAPEDIDPFGSGWIIPLAADPASYYVEYRVPDDYLTRLEHRAGKPDRCETYALPKGYWAWSEVEEAPGGRLFRLLIKPRDAADDDARAICIEAVLGRDHRFARPAEEKE